MWPCRRLLTRVPIACDALASRCEADEQCVLCSDGRHLGALISAHYSSRTGGRLHS
jgi:hypothetical protein